LEQNTEEMAGQLQKEFGKQAAQIIKLIEAAGEKNLIEADKRLTKALAEMQANNAAAGG